MDYVLRLLYNTSLKDRIIRKVRVILLEVFCIESFGVCFSLASQLVCPGKCIKYVIGNGLSLGWSTIARPQTLIIGTNASSLLSWKGGRIGILSSVLIQYVHLPIGYVPHWVM